MFEVDRVEAQTSMGEVDREDGLELCCDSLGREFVRDLEEGFVVDGEEEVNAWDGIAMIADEREFEDFSSPSLDLVVYYVSCSLFSFASEGRGQPVYFSERVLKPCAGASCFQTSLFFSHHPSIEAFVDFGESVKDCPRLGHAQA